MKRIVITVAMPTGLDNYLRSLAAERMCRKAAVVRQILADFQAKNKRNGRNPE